MKIEKLSIWKKLLMMIRYVELLTLHEILNRNCSHLLLVFVNAFLLLTMHMVAETLLRAPMQFTKCFRVPVAPEPYKLLIRSTY